MKRVEVLLFYLNSRSRWILDKSERHNKSPNHKNDLYELKNCNIYFLNS